MPAVFWAGRPLERAEVVDVEVTASLTGKQKRRAVAGRDPVERIESASLQWHGTSFAGGVGSVTRTAVGVLFIGTLQKGLAIRGVSSLWQQVVTGVILVL